jgi:hypothetical protein
MVHRLAHSGVAHRVTTSDFLDMNSSQSSDERLDRLAVHLNRVVKAMEAGVLVVTLKDELVKLHKACLEVVGDGDLEPCDDVQRMVVSVPKVAAPMIPRPFQPVDMAMFMKASNG